MTEKQPLAVSSCSWPLAKSQKLRAKSFVTVVPVNDEAKFRDNVLASPGLVEFDSATIIPVHGARSAADAFSSGKARSAAEWILFCHQDVYFPAGSGKQIATIVATIPESEARSTLLGFVGLNRDGVLAGLVNDRGQWLSGAECSGAISMDELAVVLHRETKYVLDPHLGWHLWATDLCLQALAEKFMARVLCVPVAHNSSTGRVLPSEYAASARALFEKYPQWNRIPTLNGVLRREAR